MLQFKNPQTGHVRTVSRPALWASLLGPIYFAAQGIWFHVVAGTLLGLMTFGLSWLVYPYFAESIVRASFLQRGWIEIADEGWASPTAEDWAARVARDEADEEARRMNEEARAAALDAAHGSVAKHAARAPVRKPEFGRRLAVQSPRR